MNKKEFDEKYVGEKLVVNCRTEKLADEFLKLATKFGYKWWGNDSYEKYNEWSIYEKETCYRLYYGSFSYAPWYNNLKYKIVEYKSQSSHKKYKLLIDEENGNIIIKNKNGNTGKAECLSTDEFDLGFGVKLAKARLDGDDEEVQRLLDISNKKSIGKFSCSELAIDLKININTKEMEDKLLKIVDTLRSL